MSKKLACVVLSKTCVVFLSPSWSFRAENGKSRDSSPWLSLLFVVLGKIFPNAPHPTR